MKVGSVYFVVALYIFVVCMDPAHSSRSYDLESAALRLYGEDLHSVLRRFRRSPEYLKIIKERKEELSSETTHIVKSCTLYYAKHIDSYVAELYGYEKPERNTSTSKSPDFRAGLRALRSMDPFSKAFQPRRPPLRTNENMTGVEQLEDYHNVPLIFNVKEIINLRNLGFKYAGRAIHEAIQHMDRDQNSRSTKNPPPGGMTDPPEHNHDLEITSITEPAQKVNEEMEPETTSPPETEAPEEPTAGSQEN